MPELYFIIGPTAVGKTALAIDWARANNAEILCADAPLVYRGMNIGTAKPTASEQAAVRHHGIDWVGVTERFSVGEYAAKAAEVVADVTRRGKKLLVVGGSGFYLKSFFEPVTDGLNISPEVVATAAEFFDTGGLDGLLAELRRVGGEDLTGLDVQNPRRVLKALERCLASGKSFRELREAFLNQPPAYPEFGKRVVMITRDRENLTTRIYRRIENMITDGLLEEVAALKEQGIESNPQTASVIGYREPLAYLRGELSLPAMKEEVAQNTLGLVRKQITFFKQLPVGEVLLLGAGEKGSAGMLF